jgi:hypothetical protein
VLVQRLRAQLDEAAAKGACILLDLLALLALLGILLALLATHQLS